MPVRRISVIIEGETQAYVHRPGIYRDGTPSIVRVYVGKDNFLVDSDYRG